MRLDLSRRVAGLSLERRQLLERIIEGERRELGQTIILRRPQGSDRAPASYGQRRLWLLETLAPGSALYNIPLAFELDGRLDLGALARTVDEIVRRHEVLRTRFVADDGDPVAVIDPPAPRAVLLVDLTGLPAAAADRQATMLAGAEAVRGFDLAAGRLLRVTALRLGIWRHQVLATLHHVAGDGWSLGVLMREVGELYAAFAAGRPSPLPELAIQYGDFAAWQQRAQDGEPLAAARRYWWEQLAGLPAGLDLPFDRRPPGVWKARGGVRKVTLPAPLARQLGALARRQGATIFTSLLAGLEALLLRLSHQRDFAVGTVTAGRTRVELEPLIGFFVNTLVLRSDLRQGMPSLAELLRRVKETLLAAYRHQELPFEQLVEELKPQRGTGQSPLFQVMLGLERAAALPPADGLAAAGLRLRPLQTEAVPPAKFELSITVGEELEGLVGAAVYAAELFDGATIERWLGHWRQLLAAAVAAPEVALCELPLLAAAESAQLRVEWNDTVVAPSGPACLHELVAAQARRTPEAVAVAAEGGELSYGELAARWRALAGRLRGLGVGAESVVGLCAERSLDMVIGMLAILEAGGAYLPLDPSHPVERLRFMLADSGACGLVGQGAALARLGLGGETAPGAPAALLAVSLAAATASAAASATATASAAASATAAVATAMAGWPLPRPENLAYVIYTSGSTGRPKGVMVPHRAVRNRLLWSQSVYRLQACDAVLQKAAFGFDFAVWECFAPLTAGARLVLARPGGQRDSAYLARLVAARQITVIHFIPPMLAAFLDEDLAGCGVLRQVLVGGEALSPCLRDRCLALLPADLDHQYGPTETTIDVTARRCVRGASGSSVPLGRPIANTAAHVVDGASQPVPVGVAGELCVAGVQLARGYLGRPDLTAERFVPNPFAACGGGGGERLYRTGDRARLTAAGEIEFLGRIDQQVKVRGVRIEPEEIEAALQAHPAVRRAVVVAQPAAASALTVAAEPRLVAYVVLAEITLPGRAMASGAQAIDVTLASELRRWLRLELPEPMVPAAFVHLAALPLTASGKLDRRALPVPEELTLAVGAAGVPLRTPLEEVVAGIWEEVLGVGPIGGDGNFFELGGHSLLATQVVARLRRQLGIELPLARLFSAQTVAALAAEVEAELSGAGGEAAMAPPPLVRAARQGVAAAAGLELSFAQERLWFLDQLEPGRATYNMPLSVLVSGPLRPARLASALGAVVRRHEALRTVFAVVEGAPRQVVQREAGQALGLIDLGGLPGAAAEGEARRLSAVEAARPFDLARGPLLRAMALRLSAARHVVLATLHHIASDGWSMGLLLREVAASYGAAGAGEGELPELPVQYGDYSAWQRGWLSGGTLAAEVEWWRQQLSGMPPLLELPLDRPRQAMAGRRGAVRSLRLVPELRGELVAQSRRHAATLFMTLLGSFEALLARLCGQPDFAIGTPIAGRTHVELEPLIGLFVNTLVLRSEVRAGRPSLSGLMPQVRESLLAAYRHQHLPFEKLVEELQPERSLRHSPLFQVMFSLQNLPAVEIAAADVRLELWQTGAEAPPKFELSVDVAETVDGLAVSASYAAELFDGATIERWLRHWRQLLAAALAAPEAALCELPLLAAAESAQLRVEWNDTLVAPSGPACLHELVAAQVRRTPEAVAVASEGGELSYGELAARWRALAGRLRGLGVGAESVVGLCAERSLDMVIGMLAILEAGGAYLPLDPSHPVERLRYMLADSGACGLVGQGATLARLGLGGETAPGAPAALLAVSLGAATAAAIAAAGATAAARPQPENLAYVMYTSGSTGRPKGVMVPHRGVCNRLRWAIAAYRLDAGEAMLQIALATFDTSVLECFLPLASGGRLVLAPVGGQRDSGYLVQAVRQHGITHLELVPAMLAAVLREEEVERCVSLRRICCGGEALTPALRDLHLARLGPLAVELDNTYGPTETSIDLTRGRCLGDAAGAPVTIGRPLANVALYLAGPWFELVPIGVAGELLIGGVAVTRGYLRRLELTAERFVPDPWSGVAGGRLYRSGDLVRRLADGEIEFLGRLDRQIKIRGQRVELGEIEAALAAHPAVREAAVVAREWVPASGRGELEVQLIGYYTAAAPLPASELRRWLRLELPEPMVPAAFVHLAALPLTASGKLDRRALPVPEELTLAVGAAGVPLRTPLEEVVAGIWEEVLGVGPIGGDGNFFELGGHSLLATQVVARLRRQLGIELPLARLFSAQTVAALAAEVEAELSGAGGEAAMAPPPLVRAARQGVAAAAGLELSFAQERLWFLDQLEPGRATYNMPLSVLVSGPLRPARLASALGAVVRRHEALRTVFAVVEGAPRQVVQREAGQALGLIDLGGLPGAAAEGEARRLSAVEAARPFDLARGPLLRAMALRLSAARHVVLATLHHIASDGWSMGLLLREVAASYGAAGAGEGELPELPVQYGDYSAWQRGWLSGGTLAAEVEWWRQQLSGMPPLLELPLDRPRQAMAGRRGAVRSLRLVPELRGELVAQSRRHAATLFMTLLGSFEALLARLCGQPDFAIGTPIAGRTHVELEPLIGLFVNTLVLRSEVRAGRPSLSGLMPQVRESLLAAYRHQHLPFEKLVEELQPERSLRHSPLFQVMFSLQNLPAVEIAAADVRLELWQTGAEAPPKFELSVDVAETVDGLAVSASYAAELFDGATIERWLRHWRQLLAAALAAPEAALCELPLLAAAESAQLRVEWNDTLVAPSGPACLHELVAAQVRRTPEAVAVASEGGELSYGELAARWRALAGRLRGLGVGAESVVGLCAERSLDMVIGMLAILEAGGAYLPLDPSHPVERLRYMLADSGACGLVGQGATLARLGLGGETAPGAPAALLAVSLGAATAAAIAAAGATAAARPQPENLAYVIYTSGSTGRPKGVMVPHRAVVNQLRWLEQHHPLTAADRVLQKTAIGFDASVWELFLPLLSGSPLVLARPGGERDGRYLARTIAEQRITVIQLVPTLLRAMLDERGFADAASLRTVFSGGEALEVALVARLQAEVAVPVVNLYGPTETAVQVLTWSGEPGAPQRPGQTWVPVGRPVANTCIVLLDSAGAELGIGVPGGLHIGGVQLARGYLRRPALTAESFVPDPAGGRRGEPGARLYRTGDLARWLPTGAVEFLGRIDWQVKLRGVRIELGEIEAALAELPQVSAAATVVREDGATGPRLIAYVAPSPAGGAGPGDVGRAPAAAARSALAAELRSRLAGRLPAAMIPQQFVMLASLPVTASGKLDRRALPVPEELAPAVASAVAPLRTPLEEVVAGIWEEVLGVGPIGGDGNFFELGGHSLLATQVVARLRRQLGIELPLARLFSAQTVVALAAEVEAELRGARREGAMPPPPPLVRAAREMASIGAGQELSFAQERLWFLDQLQPGRAAYNIPLAFEIVGPLQWPVLEAALSEVVRRHETLRTVIVSSAGAPRQLVRPPQRQPLPLIDLCGLAAARARQAASGWAVAEAARPFDLARDRMLRTMLLRLGAGEHVALATLHHVASDGWSTGLLLREVAALYAALADAPAAGGAPCPPLPELAIQYGDFAAWQRSWLSGGAMAAEVAWWREQLEGMPPLLDLPLDRPRPLKARLVGAEKPLQLPAATSEKLGAFARRQGATLFMVLLAAFEALLARWSSRRDFAVGVPIAGRTHVEVEPLIGLFVNVLVLRSDLRNDAADGPLPSLATLAARVRETSLAAYLHQHLPFEKLVEQLQPERTLRHSPLFQVTLALQNLPPAELAAGGVRLRRFLDQATEPVAKFDLSLALAEAGDTLAGGVVYAADLFDGATIGRWIEQWRQLLAAAVAAPDRPLSELPLLSVGGRQQLVLEWNDTACDFGPPLLLHQRVAVHARLAPEAVAVVAEPGDLSYGQLAAQASRLARRLRDLGVGPDWVVGLCARPSLPMIVGLLGILEAGGAYLPLDPSYPAERLWFMLADSGASVLVAEPDAVGWLATAAAPEDRPPQPRPRVVLLDPADAGAASSAEAGQQAKWGEASAPELSPDHLAYVIYTSGSTGRPKGVMVPHRGLSNLIELQNRMFGLGPASRVLQVASAAFDASVAEVAMALGSGGTLLLARERMLAGTGWQTLLGASTIALLPPSVLASLPGPPPSGPATLTIGGEVCPPALAQQWAAGRRLFNLYGPTESAVYCTAQLHAGGARLPIGRPLANLQAYLLDPGQRPVAIGVEGEIHLGGAGLARGYLGRPELTAERFVPDPFAASAGARLYRTGDLGRVTATGEIEFLGRIDQQLKVRGCRIEPGEIEAVLRAHPTVRDALVLASPPGITAAAAAAGGSARSPGDQRLVAYVTPAPTAAKGSTMPSAAEWTTELRELLRRRLPEHMVPAVFVSLPALPLTASGKVDRRALPQADASAAPGADAPGAPRDELELRLIAIWEEVLETGPIGVGDDFFRLGGHSLLALRLVHRISREIGRELPVAVLFQASTVERLARRLRCAGPAGRARRALVEIDGRGAGRPLFFVHPAGGEVVSYWRLARRISGMRPFYGLQAPGGGGGRRIAGSITAMARHYLRAIREVQLHGPYLLGGWSMGGLVAHEMAHQLWRQGEGVAGLLLLDPSPPGPRTAALSPAAMLGNFALTFLGDVEPPPGLAAAVAEAEAGATVGDSLRSLIELGRAAGAVPPDLEASALEPMFRTFSAHGAALAVHRARPFPCPAALLAAAAGETASTAAADWRQLLPDVVFAVAGGDHFSLLREPDVGAVASWLAHAADSFDQPAAAALAGPGHGLPRNSLE